MACFLSRLFGYSTISTYLKGFFIAGKFCQFNINLLIMYCCPTYLVWNYLYKSFRSYCVNAMFLRWDINPWTERYFACQRIIINYLDNRKGNNKNPLVDLIYWFHFSLRFSGRLSCLDWFCEGHACQTGNEYWRICGNFSRPEALLPRQRQ